MWLNQFSMTWDDGNRVELALDGQRRGAVPEWDDERLKPGLDSKWEKCCQEGKMTIFSVSDCKQWKNKFRNFGTLPIAI